MITGISAKQAVPENKYTAIIFIDIGGILAMMDPVIAGGDKYGFNPGRQFTNKLCMNKKLVDQIKGANREHDHWVNA